jgi:hypothetical protein
VPEGGGYDWRPAGWGNGEYEECDFAWAPIGRRPISSWIGSQGGASCRFESDRRSVLPPVTDAERFDDAMRSVLVLPADMDLSGVAYGATEMWDSVAHIQLVLAVEDEFGITLAPDDVVEMSSYTSARRVLRDRHGLALDG